MDKDKAKREAALEEKMKLIRKKNEERLIRLKEIEEDRANADMNSDQVAHNSARNQMMGVRISERPSVTKQFQRGRGQLLSKMSQENLMANKLEEKRRQNYKREEEGGSAGQSSASGFLLDDRRVDMGKTTRRSPHSYGGSHIGGAVIRMNRERNTFKHQGNNPDIGMSGKERLEYKAWKEERIQIDASRNERHKQGSREWDEKKEWDDKKGMWLDSNSARVRMDDPPRMDARDTWGEDTIEKVWDGKNRRWVDPMEAVSFGDMEGQDEDWENGCGGRKQRFSSSSEGSGGDSRDQKSPQHHAERERTFDKLQLSEGSKCANNPRQEVKGPTQTEPTILEDDLQDVSHEGTTDMAENSTAATRDCKAGAPADAKPKRVHVKRQRRSSGRKTSKESQNQPKGDVSKKEEMEGEQVNSKDTEADDVFFHDDLSAQESHVGAKVEKTKDDDKSDNRNQTRTVAERTEEKISEHSEKRKDNIDYVPFSPLNKEDVTIEWGDIEINEQLVLDTDTTVKW